MAAPFPNESVAGTSVDSAESEAVNLYQQYMWVARLVDEMNTETVLDLKRTWQLVLHSRQFRRWYDTLQAHIGGTHTQAQIVALIEAMFAFKKCTWTTRAAMNADLASIYNSAGTVADWIDANAADYKTGYSINKETSPGVMTDDPIKIAKSAGVATRLADFRAIFGPRP